MLLGNGEIEIQRFPLPDESLVYMMWLQGLSGLVFDMGKVGC